MMAEKRRVDDDSGFNYVNLKLPYGIAKGLGLSTKGMTPHEVWDMLKGKGISAKKEYEKLSENEQPQQPKASEQIPKAEVPATEGKQNPEETPETKVEESKGDSPFNAESYSQERKNSAVWCKSLEESKQEFLPQAAKVFANASNSQRKAVYAYTEGSGGFNRPLRGYDKQWGAAYYKGVGKVSLNNEWQAENIEKLTSLVEQSSYDKDIWVQRGLGYDGAKQLLGINGNITAEKLEKKLQDRAKFVDHGFSSCGSAKSTGFAHCEVVFNVYCPKGTKMLYAAPISAYGGSSTYDGTGNAHVGYENEMMLQRGTKFRMMKYEKGTDGRWYIDLDVIEQKPKDLSSYKQ